MTLIEWLHRTGTSQAEFARKIRKTQGAVSHWLTGRNIIPADQVLCICAATEFAVRPHDLRSDIYPNPTDALPVVAARAA